MQASNATISDYFGCSVAIDVDGIAVGAAIADGPGAINRGAV